MRFKPFHTHGFSHVPSRSYSPEGKLRKPPSFRVSTPVKTPAIIQAAFVSAALALTLVVGGQAHAAPVTALDGALLDLSSTSEAAPDWIVKQSDNICGLKNARQLSNPGKVDFASLYASTPEAKKIKRDGIDPESPEGNRLRVSATERIGKAAAQVMSDRGLCSIWKSIRSRTGRAPQDVTETVRGLL